MSTLERAIAIAAEAHAGQVDRAGEPYILHPLRVMFGVHSEQERIVAVLHDVVEDCPGWGFSRLQDIEGFNGAIVAAIDGVTKRKGEDYAAFIARSRENYTSRVVKLADLRDNIDPKRLQMLPKDEAERLHRKYWTAMNALL